MQKRILITTIFSANTLKYAITKLSPDKVICVVEKGYEKLKGEDFEIKRKAIKELKRSYEKVIEISFLKTKSLFDLYEITRDVIKEIDKIPENNEIFVHISEGRKSLAFGLSFAAYLRRDKVEGIYYVVKEKDNELMKLPLLHFPKVNGQQKRILKLVNNGSNDVDKLIAKMRKSRSVVYQYVKELEDNNYLIHDNKKLELTDFGRICLL